MCSREHGLIALGARGVQFHTEPGLPVGAQHPIERIDRVGEKQLMDLVPLLPSLTSFEVSLEAYGRRLGEIVLACVASTESPAQEIWPMTLAPGDSDTGAPRGTDRLG